MIPIKLLSIATRLLMVIVIFGVLFSIINVSANLRLAKAAGTSGMWYVSRSYQPVGVGDLTSISCPQSTDCFAVGTSSGSPAQPLILFTNNTGTNWTSQTVPTGIASLNAISCASASKCVAIGTTSISTPTPAIITTTDGGTNWTSQTVPTGIASLNAISCVSASNCVAVGTTSSSTPSPAIITTTDGGTSWTSQTVPTGVGYLNSISCASTSNCVAVGTGTIYGGAAVITTTDGGTSWTSQTLSAYDANGFSNLVAISCASVSDCVAVTPSQSASIAYALTTSNGGITWNQYNLEGQNNSAAQNPNSISCASASSDCVVVGINSGNSAAITTTDSGTTWSQDNLLSGTVSNISIQTCISITTCFAVITYTGNDQAFLVTTDSGASWSVATTPTGVTDLLFDSCWSSTVCIAYGTNSSGSYVLLYSTNDGQSWNLATMPSGISVDNVNNCPSSTVCIAYGPNSSGSYVPLYSTNGGQSWNLATMPSGISFDYVNNCPSSTVCIAEGTNSSGSYIPLYSTNDGQSWNLATMPSGISFDFYSIDCPSSTACLATGTNSIILTVNSTVSLYSTNGGQSWNLATMPSGISFGYVNNCQSSTACLADGTNSTGSDVPLYSTNEGQSWNLATMPWDIRFYPEDPVCPSSTVCFATGANLSFATVVLYGTNDGQSWNLITMPSGISFDTYSVECPSSTACLADGTNSSGSDVSLYSTNDGQSWNFATIPSGIFFDGVDYCRSSTVCLAYGIINSSSSEVVLYSTNDGESWNLATLPSGISFNFRSYNCPSSTFCLATGTNSSGSSVPLYSTNDGQSWNLATSTSGVLESSYACYSTTCVFAGANATSWNIGSLAQPQPNPNITLLAPSTGPSSGGTTVTITGSNFTGATAVNFGSTPATSFVVNSDTSITAVAPSGAGTVDISVTTPSGTSATVSSDQFSYVNYTPISPIRVCDTRPVSSTSVISNQCNNGTAGNNGSLGQGETINVNVAGTGPGGTLDSIPANASAVVANITVTNTTKAGGFLTVFPTGQPQPNTSVMNFGANESVANLVQVGIGTTGDISIYNFNGSTDVIVDIEGYVAPVASSTTTGLFVPISPTRVCDTRSPSGTSVVSNQCNNGTAGNSGPLTQGETIKVNVAGTGSGGTLDNIPANASAVVANITVTNTTQAGGFLTVYPSNLTSEPKASNLNFGPNQSVPNRVIVPIDPTNGDISIYNFNGSTDVIVDVNGYFTGSNATTGYIFSAIAPTRVCDTRSPSSTSVVSNQCNNGTTGNNGPLTQGESITVQVANIDNIPANTVAVVLNVTTTDTTNNGGFFTVYPTPTSSTSPPNASDLNWSANETDTNMVVVKVGNNNSINVYNAIGSADLIIDVMGYYTK